MDEKAADENLVELFQQWLTAFEAMQAATCEEEAVAQREVLADVEARIAASPADGLLHLLEAGLHNFLNDHAEATSIQADSAYRDLVRLTGHDPATEISRRFQVDEAEQE